MSDINVNISRMVSYIRWKILMKEFIILKNFDIGVWNEFLFVQIK